MLLTRVRTVALLMVRRQDISRMLGSRATRRWTSSSRPVRGAVPRPRDKGSRARVESQRDLPRGRGSLLQGVHSTSLVWVKNPGRVESARIVTGPESLP
jgi:hypothetical protein